MSLAAGMVAYQIGEGQKWEGEIHADSQSEVTSRGQEAFIQCLQNGWALGRKVESKDPGASAT